MYAPSLATVTPETVWRRPSCIVMRGRHHRGDELSGVRVHVLSTADRPPRPVRPHAVPHGQPRRRRDHKRERQKGTGCYLLLTYDGNSVFVVSDLQTGAAERRHGRTSTVYISFFFADIRSLHRQIIEFLTQNAHPQCFKRLFFFFEFDFELSERYCFEYSLASGAGRRCRRRCVISCACGKRSGTASRCTRASSTTRSPLPKVSRCELRESYRKALPS